MHDHDDYRQIALETPLLQRNFWVARWNKWVMIQELPGSQRSDLLQQCTDIVDKKAKVNLKKLYPMLVVLSCRYPDPANPPDKNDPNYDRFPGIKNASGEYLTHPHPKAGQLIFSITDIGPLNATPGGILELLNKPASELSGLREEDIEEKKPTLNPNTVESDGYTIELQPDWEG